jgi:hypothetical protein
LFIGRERLLDDLAEALKGLDARFGGEAPSGAAAVQVAWYDGFGGMGKSWFLRKAKLDIERRLLPSARVGLIDWYLPALRCGLLTAPSEPGALFGAIAHRLGQLYSAEALDPFWTACDRVARAAGDHQKVLRSFQSGLTGLMMVRPSNVGQTGAAGGKQQDYVQEQKDYVLREVLVKEGVWSDDPGEYGRNLEEARGNPEWEHRIRDLWCANGGGPEVKDFEAAHKPDQLLLATLQACVRSVTRTAPLVMIFDTCEVLSEEMDRWVRNLVVPLCGATCPVLFLFGSRLSPDVGEKPGDRRGWRAEIGDRLWRRVRFDRDVHFTVSEVRVALGKLRQKIGDSEEIASRLHEVTRGVPLAVRILLDLHERGDPVLLNLSDLGDKGENEENSGRALDLVIEVVTNRFLLHLESNPTRRRDTKDIVALALLPRVDHELLSRLWGAGKVRARLSELTRRYALLADGDLYQASKVLTL